MRNDRKLCNITDANERSELASHAIVSCSLCGAKAHDPANICDPVQYPDAGSLGD